MNFDRQKLNNDIKLKNQNCSHLSFKKLWNIKQSGDDRNGKSVDQNSDAKFNPKNVKFVQKCQICAKTCVKILLSKIHQINVRIKKMTS